MSVNNYFAMLMREGGELQRFALPALLMQSQHRAVYPDVSHNQVYLSDTVASALWSTSAVTVAFNNHRAPDGRVSATRITENATTAAFTIEYAAQSLGANVVRCFSVYLKSNGRPNIRITSLGNSGAATVAIDVNLTTGATAIQGITAGQQIYDHGAYDAGNGWWRVWVSFAFASNHSGVRIQPLNPGTTYAGNGTSGYYAWGAQLERGTKPTDYLATGRQVAAAPPIPQLHLAAANEFDASDWVKTALTVTPNALRGPDGVLNADLLVETTATSAHRVTYNLPGSTFSPWCASIYARAAGRTSIIIRVANGADTFEARFNLSQATVDASSAAGVASVITARAEWARNGWVRCVIAGDTTAGVGSVIVGLWNVTETYPGSTSAGVHLAGFELVPGRDVASAIPRPSLPVSALRTNGVRVAIEDGTHMSLLGDRALEPGRSYYWEHTLVASGAMRVGVARAFTTFVELGESAVGWGYNGVTGQVRNNAATLATLATFTAGDTIGVVLDWDTANARWNLRFVKNPSGAFALPAAVTTIAPGGAALYPAFGPNASTAALQEIDVNYGQRPMRGAPPNGCLAGVYALAADAQRVVGTIGAYLGDEIDQWGTMHVAPVVLNDPPIRDSVSAWVWGEGDREAGVGSVELNVADGTWDEFLAANHRDRVVELYVGPENAGFPSSMKRIRTCVVDRIERKDTATATVTLRPRTAVLATPLQTTAFPDTTPNTAVRGKPRPICLGNVRWAPVAMRDGPNGDYEVHDSSSFLAIDEVRQAGALLATPADYAVPGAGGAFGFRRATGVTGKQCARVRGQTRAGPVLIERLPDLVTWICVTKTGRLTAGDLDSAGTIAALDTAAPYTLARYIDPDQPVLASELLREVLDAFCGDYYEDGNGVLRVWRLEKPAGAPAYTFTEDDLAGDVTVVTDTAPGLTTAIGFARNFAVHSTGEIAGAVQATTIGSELASPFQVRRSSVAMASPYARASGAPARVTMLTDGTQAQTEIDRVDSAFTDARQFYSAPVLVGNPTSFWDMRFGDLVQLRVQAHDLAAGKLLRLVGIDRTPLGGVMTLRLWG